MISQKYPIIKIKVIIIYILYFAFSINGQWLPSYDPSFQYNLPIRKLTISDTSLFAATMKNGIYRSLDNGLSWTSVPGTYQDIHSLLVSEDILYAGAGSAVYRSADNGLSWTYGGDLPWYNIVALTAFKTILFAAVDGHGVFRSIDNGANWIAVNNGLTDISVSSLATLNTKIVAGTNSGVFLSADSGASWTAVNTGMSNTVVYSFAVSGTSVFAGTNNGVYLSTDSGYNWAAINTKLSNTDISSIVVSGINIFAGSPNGVYCSKNDGSSWTATNAGLTNTCIYDLVISGTRLFAGTDSGVFLSDNNGLSWLIASNGIKGFGGALYVSEIVASETNIFAGTSLGVMYSTAGETNWTNVYPFPHLGDYSYLRIGDVAVCGSNLVIGNTYDANLGGPGGSAYKGDVYYTPNNGSNWFKVLSNLWANSIFTTTNNKKAVLATSSFGGGSGHSSNSSTIYFSLDSGVHWTTSCSLKVPIASVAINNSDNLFVGTVSNGALFSSDNGLNWSPINLGLPESTTVFSFAIKKSMVFAGTSQGIFLSYDNGTNWSPINTGIPTKTNALSIAVKDSSIFTGTSNGLFLSSNNGTNWFPIDSGLPLNVAVTALSIFGGNLFAGTNGKGVWKRSLVEVISVETDRMNKATKISMESNYPNPFNSSTSIGYYIANEGIASLCIYSSNGSLLLENKVRGYGSFYWNARKQGSGIFYCKLKKGKDVLVRKILLIR